MIMLPVVVTFVPSSVIVESSIFWPVVNLAKRLVLPPTILVTPVPEPAQLPISTRHTVPDAFGKMIVLSVVGLATVRSVSKASAMEPSNNSPVAAKELWFTARLLLVKSPE